MDTMQPGQVISPQQTQSTDDPQGPNPAPAAPPQPVRPDEDPVEVPAPMPPGPEPESFATPTPQDQPFQPGAEEVQESPNYAAVAAEPTPIQGPSPEQTPDPNPTWQYNGRQSDGDVGGPQSAPSTGDDITWTASEFISHEKSAAWYGALIAAGIVAAAVGYLLTKDKVSVGVILFATLAFAAISARKPRTQQYALTRQGLQIGGKAYFFADFKNFSVTEDGAIASVVFMPLKRFMPPLTIYLSPDMEEQVLDFISQILPFAEHRTDAVDNLMRRIRF